MCVCNNIKMVLNEGKNICVKCGRSIGYVRIRTQEYVCRNCGHIQSMKKEEEKNGS